MGVTLRVALSLVVVALLTSVSACDRSAEVARPAVPTPTSTATPTMTLTPSVTPKPSITPTPAFSFRTFQLRETFDSAQHMALQTGVKQHTSYGWANGGYTIHISDSASLAWSPVDGIFANTAISVDARLDQGPANTAAGIIFRYQDDSNFYLFSVASDGNYALDLLQNGRWTPIIDWTDASQIKGPGNINHLRVELAGDRMRLYVNDTLLDEVSDTTFTQGAVALAVHTFDTGNAVATFDNLVIETP